MLESGFVYRTGGRGRIAVFLGGHGRAFQGQVVEIQGNLKIQDILLNQDFPRPVHIAQARHGHPGLRGRNVPDDELALGISHGPLLGTFQDHGREVDRFSGALVCHRPGEGVFLSGRFPAGERQQTEKNDPKLSHKTCRFSTICKNKKLFQYAKYQEMAIFVRIHFESR